MTHKAARSLLLGFWLVPGFWLAAGGWLAGQTGAPASAASGQASAAPGAPATGVVKQLGSIRQIDGSRLVLATDQGAEIAVQLQPGARLLRLAPGQTDLKNATAIQAADLQVSDRVLVRGKMDADGVSLDAVIVLVMKQQDIAQRQREELLDWQRRGVGGLVQQVDVAAGTVTISLGGAGLRGTSRGTARETSNGEGATSSSLLIRSTPKTVFKRYAPDSVKWEDAVASRLDEIQPGDQLRALGTRNEDGTELEAGEIVSGSFRNIAGRISSIDAAQGTLTVEDLATKKPVTVKIGPSSQMRTLPPMLAERLAMRLKRAAPDAEAKAVPNQGAKAAPQGAPGAAPATTMEQAQGGAPEGGRGGRWGAGAPARGGLNQMLSRLPAATLGDLQKGEAVMIVSTMGAGGRLPEAVTLLGGVEAILTASPGGRGTESLLTPWALASAPGGEEP